MTCCTLTSRPSDLERTQFWVRDDDATQPTPTSTTSIFDNLCKYVRTAAKTVLPDRIYAPVKARGVSDRTQALFEQRTEAKASDTSPQQLKDLQKEIKGSCLRDFQEWVNDNVCDMEKANAVGDTRKVFAISNHLSKKGKKPPINLTSDNEGILLNQSPGLRADPYL